MFAGRPRNVIKRSYGIFRFYLLLFTTPYHVPGKTIAINNYVLNVHYWIRAKKS